MCGSWLTAARSLLYGADGVFQHEKATDRTCFKGIVSSGVCVCMREEGPFNVFLFSIIGKFWVMTTWENPDKRGEKPIPTSEWAETRDDT